MRSLFLWLVAVGITLFRPIHILLDCSRCECERAVLTTHLLEHRYIETAVTFCEAGLMLFLVLFYQESFCTPLNIAAMGLYAAAAVLLATTDRDTVDVVLPVFALYASVGR